MLCDRIEIGRGNVSTHVESPALDGVQAQLMRRTKIGYTVKLLESKDAFRKGESVHLSRAEFHIAKGETP